MPLWRYESSGNLDNNVSNDLFNIKYDGGQSTDELEAVNLASLNNDESVLTNKPVIIYSYDTTVIWGGPAGAVWQYYGDDDDHSTMNVWDLTSKSFQEGMRNKKFIGATVESGSRAPNFKVYKLSFKARKNPRKMRAKFGKWAVKPIVIGPHTKNTFGFSLVNLRTGDSGTSYDNARYYGFVEIKSWQTEF
jgi:hypothetical protein